MSKAVKECCVFCGKEVTGDTSVKIQFPDGKMKSACLTHHGVKEELSLTPQLTAQE